MANRLDDLKRRRAAWAKEIGGSNEWSGLAPQFVRELDAEIAAQGTEARRAETENTGSVHGGPVAESDAPTPFRNLSGDGR